MAFLGTAVALYLLIALLYTTINQMRAVEIIDAIHHHILLARRRQLPFIEKTRRASRCHGGVSLPVKANKQGFVTRIDLDALGAAAVNAQGEAEVVLLTPIGSYAAFQDVIAEVKAQTIEEAARIGRVAHDSIRLERQRDLALDPAYGIEQLEMIAWTSTAPETCSKPRV